MEVHRQRCQDCGGRTFVNIIVRAPGRRQVILVQCHACKELVARYELSGYYHHKKGFESYLKTLSIATESTIDLQESFVKLKEHSPVELQEALAVLEERLKGQETSPHLASDKDSAATAQKKDED